MPFNLAEDGLGMLVPILVVMAAVALVFILARHKVALLVRKPVTTLFHYFSYRDGGWDKTHWMGVPILKLPSDLWLYHEVLWETRPDLILEMGTNKGGSAYFFAHLFELMGTGGRIVTVDIARPVEGYPSHLRIEYVTGSSTDPAIVAAVLTRIRPEDRVMVILDSDHSEGHVRKELDLYAALVTPGCYLIVEDTNVNGHPVSRSHGPGPMEALDDFLRGKGGQDFSSDLSRDRKFGFTFHPRGWLKREGTAGLGQRLDASTRNVTG
jgi:cephalosporin hydroxylase